MKDASMDIQWLTGLAAWLQSFQRRSELSNSPHRSRLAQLDIWALSVQAVGHHQIQKLPLRLPHHTIVTAALGWRYRCWSCSTQLS